MTTITRMSKTGNGRGRVRRRISEGPIISFPGAKFYARSPNIIVPYSEPYVWQGRCERTPVRGFVPPSPSKPSPQPPPPPPPLPVVVKLAGQTDIRRGACTVSPRRGWQGGRRGKPWGLAEDEAAVCRQNSTSCATLTKARALWINYCNYIISLFRYPPSPPRYRNDTDSNWPETWSSRDGGK